MALGKTCRYCLRCELIMAHQDELEAQDAIDALDAQCPAPCAQPLVHTRSSHTAGQMGLLAETPLPFRLLEVFQYGTNLCETGTHPLPQGLLIL